MTFGRRHVLLAACGAMLATMVQPARCQSDPALMAAIQSATRHAEIRGA